MTATEIDFDDTLLANAQEILGTNSAEETIRAAMREVLRNSPPFQGLVPVIEGEIALPQQVIVRYGLDQPGAQVEMIERKGVIEIKPRPAKP